MCKFNAAVRVTPKIPCCQKTAKVHESHSRGCPELVAGYELIQLRAIFNKRVLAQIFLDASVLHVNVKNMRSQIITSDGYVRP